MRNNEIYPLVQGVMSDRQVRAIQELREPARETTGAVTTGATSEVSLNILHGLCIHDEIEIYLGEVGATETVDLPEED